MTSNITKSGFFSPFLQILVNLFSETLSLGENILEFREKCLCLYEKFGVLLQKAENFCYEICFQQKLQKGLWNPQRPRGPGHLKYQILVARVHWRSMEPIMAVLSAF